MDPLATSRSRSKWLFRDKLRGRSRPISGFRRSPWIADDHLDRSCSGGRQATFSGLVRKFAHVCGGEHTCRSAESRREFGAGADDCVSSVAIVERRSAGTVGGAPKQQRGTSSPLPRGAPADRPFAQRRCRGRACRLAAPSPKSSSARLWRLCSWSSGVGTGARARCAEMRSVVGAPAIVWA
jgi:hypothetical protein